MSQVNYLKYKERFFPQRRRGAKERCIIKKMSDGPLISLEEATGICYLERNSLFFPFVYRPYINWQKSK